ncbi:MAG: ABC transporter ATP-binding protein [Pusillimonas sp.]|nr:ABC transporter ATP-binding protein [Pusillimonas sp.]MBC42382.1 ABC transporter ATP-binding protein [Pusillimonas sp.]
MSQKMAISQQAKANDLILQVERLSVQLRTDAGAHDAVHLLDLALRRGETFALVGESGCGKSMTAMALLRLLPEAARITSGKVLLEQTDLNRLAESHMRQFRGGQLAMVFQEPSTSLNPVMPVGRQIVETLLAHTDYRGHSARERAIYWMTRVGIRDAQTRFNDYPFQFSGGQKQRIMIAIALAAEPAVLIADEPTTALDVTVQGQILHLLADIQAEMGLAILLITHDLAVVKKVARYVALMKQGEIVETGLVESFFENPQHSYARQLINAIPAYEKRGRSLVTGEPLVEAGNATESMPAPVLQVRNLSVAYPQRGGLLRRVLAYKQIVEDVSFDLHPGETLALLGESGCGKTTTAKTLMSLLDRQARISGEVWLDGQSIFKANVRQRRVLRQSMQIVFQDPYASLDPRMVVGEVLEEGVAALRPELDRKQRANRIRDLLDRVGLPANTVARYPHEFSGGQRQRIAIARALAVEPKVLICDEPTSALDVSVQAQILELLQDLQQELGMAYLFITHNFGVVEYLSDRIAIMDAGKLVEMSDTVSVLLQPQHEQTRRLLAAVPRL